MVTYTPFKALHGAKIEDDGNAEINVERYSGANIRIQSQASAGRIETTNSHELWLGANATGRIEIQSGGLVSIPGALTVSGTFNATLATAAQTNITSLGSLSSLDVNGDATVSGNLSLDGSNKELRFYEGSNYVGFEAPALSANKIWVLPASDGSANQALTTDGSGNFQWSSASSIAGAGSNLSLANGTNNRIVTAVDGSNLNGEANLTFDGSTLTVAGNALVANNGSVKANGSGSLLLGNTSSGVIKVHGNTTNSIIEGYANHLVLQTVRDDDDIIFNVNAGGTDSDSTVVEAMRIHGPDGNVGIGTTSPTPILHIKADNSTTDMNSAGAAGITIEQDGAGDAALSMLLSGTRRWMMGIDNSDADKLKFATGGTDVATGTIMTLASDGKVGIGTAAPDTTLHVEGSVLIDAFEAGAGAGLFFREGFLNTNQPSITVQDHSGANPDGLAISAYDGISFRLNAVEKARFDSAGKFGIGTTSPATVLHVESADNDIVRFKSTDDLATFTLQDNDTTAYFNASGGSAGHLSIGGNAGTHADNLNINVDTGNVGIGTNSPSHKLHLSDSSRVDIKFSKDSSEDHYIRKDGDYLRFRGHDDSTILMEMRNNSSSNHVSFPSGKVGIGTNTPSSLLHIHGDMGDGKEGILITRNDASTADTNLLGAIGFDSSDGNIPSKATEASAGIAAYAAEAHGTGDKGGDLVLFTSPIDQNDDTDALERVRITSEGYVGINTTDPCSKLHIGGYCRVFSDTSGYLDGNIFNSYSWSPMSDLSSPPIGFTINGAANENSIVYGQTPLGSDDNYYARGLLWRFQDSGDGNASGGFLTATPYPKIDINKSYRMSVWVKRSHLTEGAYYMGFYGYDGSYGSNVGVQDVSRRGTCDGAITTTGTFTANFSSGSATLTNISINTNLLVTGMSLFDVADGTFDGIPDNTTIQSIDSSSQITMSANATATGTGRGVNYGKTSITLDSGHSLLDGNGSTTRYAVLNNVDRISYTDIDNNVLTGIPLTGEYAISQAHADNAKIMQLETNAYFATGDLPEVDKWYLVVGYVQGQGDTDYTDRGAVYDGETGNRVAGAGNFQWWSQSTYVRNRVYMYYSDDNPEQIQHAFDPRFEEISGAPHINALLGGKITTGMTIKNDVATVTPTSGYVSLGEFGGVLEVKTLNGYLRLGATNGSYNHIVGENAKFYFNKPLVIDGGNTSGSAYQISSYASEDLVLATQDGAENRISIKSDTGNVGIGVTAPSEKLEVAGNIQLDDDNKLIVGTGGDLKIYHDGSNSYIDEEGTGSLIINSTQVALKGGSDAAENMATFIDNGAATLYHNNSSKFATTATGALVTGEIKTSLGNINSCVSYVYNRSDMNTSSANLKAVSNDASSSQNHWGFIMPKSGTVKYFTLNTRAQEVTSTAEQTWKINNNNNNSSSGEFFQIAVAKGATQDNTGVSGDATMELTQSPHSSTIWRGSVVVNHTFDAGDEIRIQRTNANSVDMGDTTGVMYVEFD